MKGKLYAMAALAGIMLAACNNQDEPTANNGSLEGTPIRVTTQVMEAETRAEMGTDDLTEFYFRVTDEGGTTTDYDYFTKMTKGEDGNWTAETSEIAWKTTKAQVSAVAQKTASGWEAWTQTDYDSGKEVSVLTDQSSSTTGTDGYPSDENVKASDLLYMPATVIDPSNPTAGQISSDGKVVVNMKHAFAKLNITVSIGTAKGGDGTNNPITALTVGGTKLKATFKPADATPLTEITANNPATDITARNESYTAASTTTNLNAKAEAVYECIVIPQRVADGIFTVTATINGKSYTYTHNGAIDFAGNKKYTLALNLGQNTMGIAGSVTVNGFDETIDMGGGEMPEPDPAMILTDDTSASDNLSGSGTSDSPYLINSAADLKKFIDMVSDDAQSDTYFKLNADLTINTTTWTPIGRGDLLTFNGIFDGNNKTIRGQLKAGSNPPSSFGFFGSTTSGTVKNLHMATDVTYSENSSSFYVGGIVGYCTYGSITGCTNSGSIDGGKYTGSTNYPINTGGIVGNTYNGSVSDCTNSGDVKGTECTQNGSSKTGGIVGVAGPSTTLTGCTNSGTVTGGKSAANYSNTGGIAGSCYTITNCTNSGDVKQAAGSEFSMGGISGYLEGAMHQCSNSGRIYKTTTTSSYQVNYGGLLAGYIASNVAIYSCCTANGTLYEADGTESTTQYIGGYSSSASGGITEKTPCPDSHTSGN